MSHLGKLHSKEKHQEVLLVLKCCLNKPKTFYVNEKKERGKCRISHKKLWGLKLLKKSHHFRVDSNYSWNLLHWDKILVSMHSYTDQWPQQFGETDYKMQIPNTRCKYTFCRRCYQVFLPIDKYCQYHLPYCVQLE